MGFKFNPGITIFASKQLRSLAGVKRSVAKAKFDSSHVGSKRFTHGHCLLNVQAMNPYERAQLSLLDSSAWGGAYVVGTIVKFIRVYRSGDGSGHVVVKVAVYHPPPHPLTAVDPLSKLLVVDRSRSVHCYFCPRSLGATIALGRGVPGFSGEDQSRYWCVLRVDNP